MAASATNFTAGQAEALLDNFQGRGWNNQAIGTYLVEFIRTCSKSRGVPDIHPRFSNMIRLMAEGEKLEKAFQNAFGVSADAVAEAFLAFLKATQNNPHKRLQYTMWQSIKPSQSTESLEVLEYFIDWLDYAL